MINDANQGRHPDGTRIVPEDEQHSPGSSTHARILADEYEDAGKVNRPPIRLLRSMAFSIDQLSIALRAAEEREKRMREALATVVINTDDECARAIARLALSTKETSGGK